MYLVAGAELQKCGKRATHGASGASGAVQSYSNNKQATIFWEIPRGLRLRASLRVSLRMSLARYARKFLVCVK